MDILNQLETAIYSRKSLQRAVSLNLLNIVFTLLQPSKTQWLLCVPPALTFNSTLHFAPIVDVYVSYENKQKLHFETALSG
jgi:hypothetical protein